MPGIRPFHFHPEVEFIARQPITAEDCVRELEGFLQTVNSDDTDTYELAEVAKQNLGDLMPMNTSLRRDKGGHLATIIDSLRNDWVPNKDDPKLARCFSRVQARMAIHLHPHYLGPKLEWGLRQAARTLLLRWSPELGIMPWTIRSVKPTGAYGAVVPDSPWIHFLANLDMVGFSPVVGQWLKGSFCEVQSAQGVSLRICGVQNAFIRKDLVPPTLSFNVDKNGWVTNTGEKLGPSNTTWFQVDNMKDAGRGHLKFFGAMSWGTWFPEHMTRPSAGPKRQHAANKASSSSQPAKKTKVATSGNARSASNGAAEEPEALPPKRPKAHEPVAPDSPLAAKAPSTPKSPAASKTRSRASSVKEVVPAVPASPKARAKASSSRAPATPKAEASSDKGASSTKKPRQAAAQPKDSEAAASSGSRGRSSKNTSK